MLDKDELIEKLRKRVGEVIAEKLELQAENKKLAAIYKAADLVMMQLGLDGEIHNLHERVETLRDAIHEYDGGDPKYVDAEIEGAPV